MAGFSWQQLGGWTNVVGNLGDWHLDGFASAAGAGRYLLPLLVNSNTADENVADLARTIQRCSQRGIRVGAWVNCFGEDPDWLAGKAAEIVLAYNLAPVVLDAEAAYQGNTKFTPLLRAFRKVFPLGTRALAVTTNSLNDSCVYNGREDGLSEAEWRSFRDLNVHVLPQWYSGPVHGWPNNPWTVPTLNMAWLQAKGMEDNLHDSGYPDGRAVALDSVHAVVEVTGLESSDLATELANLLAAKHFGYGFGLSLYLLENVTSMHDFDLVRQYRGSLFR